MIKKIRRRVHSSKLYKTLGLAKIAGQQTTPSTLFKGDDEIFKSVISDCEIYAEYGCGASTIWVANNTTAKIYSTDSSGEWIQKVKDDCPSDRAIHLHHADLGRLGKWGRPISHEKCENFSDYTDWVWQQGISPDLILVDGRFRVCCFLTSLLSAREGSKIIFDDYTNRPHYHFVERYLKRSDVCGRQALFVVPEKSSLNLEEIKYYAGKFQFVMD